MPARNISASVILLGIGGSVLAYSGLRGKSVSTSIRALLAGQSPATTAQSLGITPTPVLDASGTNIVPSNTSGGASQQAFYSAVLTGLGIPVTQGALNGLAGVTHTEGVNGYNNPFNIEWHPGDNPAWQGTASFNDVGVQEYGSFNQGVSATVAYLQGNSHWSNVVAALKTGNQAMVEAALTSAYTWAQFKPAGSDAASVLSAPVSG